MHERKLWRKALSTTLVAIVIVVILVAAVAVAYVALTGTKSTSSTTSQTSSLPTTTSTTSAAPVTVNVISFDQGLVWTNLWNATSGAPLAPLKNFESKYNVIINVEFDDEATVREKVEADMAAGTGHYDITLADSDNLVDVYSNAGLLYPLNEFYTPGSPLYTPLPTSLFNESDFLPQAMSMLSLGGSVYALPYFTFASSFNYRSDLFQKYNIQVPTTAAQLMNTTLPALKAAMQKDGTYGTVYPVAVRGEPKETTALDVDSFIYGFGGCWFQGCLWNKSAIIAHDAQPTLNSTAVVQAINAYANMGKLYSTPDSPSYDFSKEISLYEAGKAAILYPQSVNAFVAQDGAASSIKSDMTYAPTVTGPTGLPLDELWSLSFGISKATKNPTAAWLALAFLTDYANQLYFATNVFPCPSLLSVLHDPAVTSVWGASTMQIMINALNDANPHFIPNIPETNAINVEIGEVTSAVMAGSMTAEQAGQTLQNYAATLLYADNYYS
jgi:sorbitol/mannitol transport system substrate-binding protein